MPKRDLAVSLTVIIILALVLQVVNVADANPIPYPKTPSTELPTLIVDDPENQSEYYSDNIFKIDFTIIKPESWNSYYKGFMPYIGTVLVELYADGKPRTNNQIIQLQTSLSDNKLVTYYTATFGNLTHGEHVFNIVVIAKAYYETQYRNNNNEIITTGSTVDTYITQAISFQLDPSSKTVTYHKSPQTIGKEPSSSPPIPIITSPQNITYTTEDSSQFTIPLDFTINGTTSWVGYSLDNQTVVTIHTNSTLSNLGVGLHNITLFTNDLVGKMGTSNTTYFTVNQQVKADFDSLPILLALPIVAVVLVIGVLVFTKLRANKKPET